MHNRSLCVSRRSVWGSVWVAGGWCFGYLFHPTCQSFVFVFVRVSVRGFVKLEIDMLIMESGRSVTKGNNG